MEKIPQNQTGLKKLIDFYKNTFRIPENLDFYSDEDYKKAERKFVKHALKSRNVIPFFPESRKSNPVH